MKKIKIVDNALAGFKEVSSFVDGLACVTLPSWERSYLDVSGNVLFPFCQRLGDASFSNGFALLSQGDRHREGHNHGDTREACIINRQGDSIPIPKRYGGHGTKRVSFSKTLILLKLWNTHVDSLNPLTQEITKTDYSTFKHFSGGLIAVRKNFKWGFLNQNAELPIPCDYKYVQPFSEAFAAVKKENEPWHYINERGDIVLELGSEFVSVGSFSNGLAPVKKSRKGWGFIDKEGHIIISCQYSGLMNDEPRDRSESPQHFSEGFCWVRNSKKKWGVIDAKGQLVINYTYDVCKPFSEGLAIVGLWGDDRKIEYGYIDSQGNLPIPCEYARAESFSSGWGLVRKHQDWKSDSMFINKQGNPMERESTMSVDDLTTEIAQKVLEGLRR